MKEKAHVAGACDCTFVSFLDVSTFSRRTLGCTRLHPATHALEPHLGSSLTSASTSLEIARGAFGQTHTHTHTHLHTYIHTYRGPSHGPPLADWAGWLLASLLVERAMNPEQVAPLDVHLLCPPRPPCPPGPCSCSILLRRGSVRLESPPPATSLPFSLAFFPLLLVVLPPFFCPASKASHPGPGGTCVSPLLLPSCFLVLLP